MATPVWIVVCNQPSNASASYVYSQCPSGNRVLVQTTLEQIKPPVEAPQEELDPATVATVFTVAFSAVVLFFLVARGAGSVLRLIRFG